MIKYYNYIKNRYELRQILIKRYGKKEGLQKFRAIIKFYKKKKAIIKAGEKFEKQRQ